MSILGIGNRHLGEGGAHNVHLETSNVRLILPILALLLLVIMAYDCTGSEEVLDNFEWKVPGMSRISGVDQRSEAVLTDQVTDEVYVVYVNREIKTSDWTVNSLVCAKVDVESGQLVDRWAFDYLGNTHSYRSLTDRAYIVHDDVFYTLFYSEADERVHLRTNNDTMDRLTLALPTTYPVPHFRIIGIDDDHLYFMVLEEKNGESWYYQYSIDLDDYVWTKATVMVQSFETARVEYLLKDRVLYLLMERAVQASYPYIYDFVLDGINMSTGERMYPRKLEIEDINSYAEIRFDIDTDGDLHIILENNERFLHKVKPSGELLASTNLTRLWGEGNESYRIYEAEVRVNRTDHVYVIGRSRPNHNANGALVSFVLSSDYTNGILRHVIFDGDPRIFLHGGYTSVNRTGEVYVAWYTLIDDLVRVLFSHQIPLTPDLQPDGTGFHVDEEPSDPEPVTISIPIENVGRAQSRYHWVEISFALNGSHPFERLIDRRVDHILMPGESYLFDLSRALPKGSHRIRVSVYDVSPYENNKSNNVFEAWFYVSNNNLPTIEVLTPMDGQAVKDRLVISGITQDLETDGPLTTYITASSTIDLEIEGRGIWNRTIDTADLVSGEYVLSFRAYDGTDYSGYVLRRVTVSRDIDMLRLDSLFPTGDIELIEGEEMTIFYNVSDPLSRPLDHRWRMGSGDWLIGGSYHHFIADTPGRFSLQVEVSNSINSLSHEWNITVIELVPPYIEGFTPEETSLNLGKWKGLNLSIVVGNPHDLPYHVTWTLDGNVFDGNTVHSRHLSLGSSGVHSVSAILMSGIASDSVTWKINIMNSAPVLGSRRPTELVLSIKQETEVTFEVLATDADGDPLEYLWILNGDEILNSDSRTVTILLPCNNSSQYFVEVFVSDEDSGFTLSWTIQPDPHVTPTIPPEDPVRWKAIGLTFSIFIAAIVSLAYAFYYVRNRSGQDPAS